MDMYGLDKSILAVPQAKDLFNNFQNLKGNSLFVKIANRPWNVPKQGDIMVWGSPYGAYKEYGTTKYAGHTGIFNEGNVWRFSSIEQNNPLNTPVHVQNHNDLYRGVLGWLHRI